MPVVFHSYRIGPSTMKNRGSPAAFVGERVTSKEGSPREGGRPPGGPETVTWRRAPVRFGGARSPAVATKRARARRTGAPGGLGIGSRMGPPPHPQADDEERRPVDDVALEHPIRYEQDERGEDPERELEALKVHMISDGEDREEADLGDDEQIPPHEHVSVRGGGREPEASRGWEGRERGEHRRRPGGWIPGDERSVDQEEDARRDPAEGDKRRAHIAAVPMPVPEEQERRQEPRGLLECARDAVPEAGPGRPGEVRRHEESGDDPEDVGDAPRRKLDELEGHHEADRGDATERWRGAEVQNPESRQMEREVHDAHIRRAEREDRHIDEEGEGRIRRRAEQTASLQRRPRVRGDVEGA